VPRDDPDVILLAASPGPSTTIVVIIASRAVFGRPNKGFTLIGGSTGRRARYLMTAGGTATDNRRAEAHRRRDRVTAIGASRPPL
jgi:hypothetical protein